MCLLVASIVFACKESQDDKEILKKTPEELGLGGTSYLKFENISIDHVNANKISSLAGEGYEKPINNLTTEISSKSMASITEKLDKIEGFDKAISSKLLNTIFYLKNANLEKIKMEDVEAVSIILFQGENSAKHVLFKRAKENPSNFIVDDTYTTICDQNQVSATDISYIAGTALKNYSSVNWVRYIDIEELSNMKPIVNNSEVNKNLKKIAINNATFLLSKKANPNCVAVCQIQAEGDCIHPDPNSSRWDYDQPCLLEKSIEKGKTVNKSSRIAQIFELDNIRDIRDNYMVKTEKGKEYIDYYDKMTQVSEAFDVINVSNAYEHLIVAQELMGVMKTLVSGKKSEIVIDNEAKENYLKLINDYRKVTKNKEFQSMLNIFENDVKNLTSKNKESVMNYIQ